MLSKLLICVVPCQCHDMVSPPCRKNVGPVSSSGVWGGPCSSCGQSGWSDCYHPIQQHSTGTWPRFCLKWNLNRYSKINIFYVCLIFPECSQENNIRTSGRWGQNFYKPLRPPWLEVTHLILLSCKILNIISMLIWWILIHNTN